MKSLLATVLISGSLLAQQSTPEPEQADSDYPLTLTVTSAHRFNRRGYTTTEIIGWLNDDPERQQITHGL